MTDQANSIARAFVDARRRGGGLADYPGAMPQSLGEAYAIQDAALALADRPVAGWKVGRTNPPVEGADRMAGPILADGVVTAGDVVPAMPIFADGFGAAEAEFLLRVGTAPDPAKTSYTLDEAAALLDAVHVGIEIAGSPFAGINAHGSLVTISDFGNNSGLVVGRKIEGWPSVDLLTMPIAVDINGETAGAAAAATMLDGPIGAARFLFEMLAARGIAMTPGQWISSGAVTGIHKVRPGDAVTARFGTLAVACTIVAA